MINRHPKVVENLFFDIDKINKYTTINSINNSPFTLDFTSNNINNDRCLGWLLGFRDKIYKEQSRYKSKYTYTGDKSQCMYLILNDYNICDNNSQVLLLGNTYIEQNLAGKIYINNNEQKIDSKKRTYSEPVSITKIGIKLLNEYGESININNIDYTFTIDFEITE